MRISIIVLLLIAPLALALSSKELKIGVTQEFENFNPLVMSMLSTSYMYRVAGRTLNVLDENGEWVPQLAVNIPTLEAGQARFVDIDGKRRIQYTWTIKPNAKWGDGTPVTCEDVKFSWQVAMSPNLSIPDLDTYSQVKEIRIDPKDPKKCTFINEARWDFLGLAGFYIVPKHLEQPIFEKYKNEPSGYEKNSNYNTNPTLPGLYNGPYMVEEVKLGSHVSFKRNPHFYGKKPYFDKLVFRLIPNTGTLEANLRSGTIDMISTLGLSFDQALAFEKKVKKEKLPFDVRFKPSLVYEHVDVDLEHPILKDHRVREALVLSINRDDLTKALFEGRQRSAIHAFSPLDPWYTDDPKKVVLYKFSRRQAKKLLDQAGWKMQKDGYRAKNGQRLKLALITTAGNKVRELVQVYLKDQWKQVGIDVELSTQPARVFFGETVRKRKFDGMAMYAFVSAPGSNPREMMHSSEIPTKENNYSGRNRPAWRNKEVDQLIDQMDGEFDSMKRTQIAHKILYHYTKDIPVIPLYYRSDVSVVPAKMRGYKMTGHAFGSTNHVEKWNLNTK